MTTAVADLTEDQIDSLLREAEERLAAKNSPAELAVSNRPFQVAPRPPAAGKEVATLDAGKEDKAQTTSDVAVRVPQLDKKKDKKNPDDAGPGWFGLPKTVITPETKRDFQVLRMRGVIDAKHHFRKDTRKDLIPKFSVFGTIVDESVETGKSSLTRKERRQTIAEEVLASQETNQSFKKRYGKIQEKTTSGKKAFYKKLLQRPAKLFSYIRTLSFDSEDDIWPNYGLRVGDRLLMSGIASQPGKAEKPERTDPLVRGQPFQPRLMMDKDTISGCIRKDAAEIPNSGFSLLAADDKKMRMAAGHATRAKEPSSSPRDAQQTGLPATKDDPAAGPEPRLPRAVQSLYLRPLRREVEYGVPTADLQLRSYSMRSLEFFADFALRAAYLLHLPAFGPVPLPRITERWTVPRSHFIFKKSQENFERVTVRRLIQIRDGHPETVRLWLAVLQKHAYPGVGMKANVWEYDRLGVGKAMDAAAAELESQLEPQWAHLGEGKINIEEAGAKAKAGEEGPGAADPEAVREIKEFLASERVRLTGGR